jgi:hypothetical protein
MTVVQFDRVTGEIFDLSQNDLRRENIELREKINRLEEQLSIELEAKRLLHRQNQALLKERNESDQMDPMRPQCERVFRKWQAVLRPDAREFGKQRYEAVRARLNGGYTVEMLFTAIDGAALLPKHITGSQRKQMQELEYICRHPKHVDNMISSAGVPSEPDWVLAFRGRPDTFVPSTVDVKLAHSTGSCPVCGFFAMLSPEGHWWPSTDRLWCERECSQESMVEALLA